MRVEEFLEVCVGGKGLRPSTQREYKRILQGPDTAHLGMKSVDQITKDDVVGVLGTMERRGSKGAAERSLAYLRKFFGWCADQGLIDLPPTAKIRVIRPNKARDRVLSDKEIATVWLAFNAEDDFFGSLFKLLLLTGQRRGEVAGMRWSEIAEGNGTGMIWEIPRLPFQYSQEATINASPLVIFYGRRTRRVVFAEAECPCIGGCQENRPGKFEGAPITLAATACAKFAEG